MRIVRNIKFIGRQFKLGRQEDAHEFTRCLIDLLHRTALKAAGVKESSPLATTSFVHRIFGGFLRSQIRCLRCGRESNTFDPFLDVPLELSGKTTSVDRAFKLFTVRRRLVAAAAAAPGPPRRHCPVPPTPHPGCEDN